MMNHQMLARQMMQSTPSPLDDQLAPMGRRGDMMLAHITPREAMALRMMGGSGTINPQTGLLEFWDDGGNDPGGEGGTGGSTGDQGGGDSSGGMGYGAYGGGEYGYGIDAGQNIGYDYGFDPSESYSPSAYSIVSDMAAANENNASIGRGEGGTGYGGGEETGFLSDLVDQGRVFSHNISVDPLGTLAGAAKGAGKSLSGMAMGNFMSTPAGLFGFGIAPALGIPAALAGMYFGNQLGQNMFGELSMPSEEDLSSVQEMAGSPYGNNAYATEEGAMQSTPDQAAQDTQSVTQPEAAPSFDRDQFGMLGQSMIQSQTRNLQSGAKSSSAKRGLGADSGQMANQLAVMRQQQQQKMAQWQKMMGNPNLGYNDLAQSLMNIMA